MHQIELLRQQNTANFELLLGENPDSILVSKHSHIKIFLYVKMLIVLEKNLITFVDILDIVSYFIS